jgi:hypothetical protein
VVGLFPLQTNFLEQEVLQTGQNPSVTEKVFYTEMLVDKVTYRGFTSLF